jgi:hypothetical protein
MSANHPKHYTNQGPPAVPVLHKETFQFMRETTLQPDGRVYERWAAATSWETSDIRFRPQIADTSILGLVAGLISKGLSRASTSSERVAWPVGEAPKAPLSLKDHNASLGRRIAALLK